MNPLRLLVVLLTLASTAYAHAPATSHVAVSDKNGPLQVRIDIALVDLLPRIPLDADGDLAVRWQELQAAQFEIAGTMQQAFALQRGGERCDLRATAPLALASRDSEPYASMLFSTACAEAHAPLVVSGGILQESDPLHRTLVTAAGPAGSNIAYLTAATPSAEFKFGETSNFGPMLREGFAHILEGYDHLLFLLLLALPAAGYGLRGVPAMLGIVTAFTVAHSLTLAASTLGLVSVSGRLVEVAIAGSIAVAGLMNAWRPHHRIGWRLAFGFGLLHGFGFAGALAETGLGQDGLLAALLGFNLGVEAGQLLLVMLALPVLYFLSRLPLYYRLTLPVLSLGAAFVGLSWAIARL